jgi:hypothetical protein
MLERLMSKRVELWVVGLLGVAAVATIVLVSAAARLTAEGNNRFGIVGRAALEISLVPEHLARAARLALHGDKGDLAVGEARFAGRRGFEFSYAPGTVPDAGYLLLSRYDGDRSRTVVELIDLTAQKTVYSWEPDFAALNARSSLRSRLANVARDNAPGRARAMHPFVTARGELVFQNMSPLVKIGPCNETVWTIDRLFHHSIQGGVDGGYLASTFVEPQTIPGVSRHFKEDAIVVVSEQGEIRFEKSLARLLIENGLSHLIYGLDFYSDDPLHLNDVEPVLLDGAYFRKGDLFLSLRNVSAIVLYRPSTNRVLWIKQGPWVNQHDVNVLDDHRISVFNNNRFNYARRAVVDGSNDVVIYDFARDSVSTPYRSVLRELDVRTISEGRATILPDADLIFEESDYGRVLQVHENGQVAWQYVNRASDDKVYLLHWSRYLAPRHGAEIVSYLRSVDCRRM